MALTLKKPLAFFDLETTGLNISNDRIVEIAITKLMPNGEKLKKRKLINPEMPISAESAALHGITNEMVKDAPTFKQVAHEIKQFIDGADLGGYNSNRYDVPLLVEEFLRAGLEVDLSLRKLVDVQHIFYTMEPRTLSAAYKFYCNQNLTDAHSAEADVDATVAVLEAQLERYPKLGTTVEDVLKVIGDEKIVDYARRMVFDQNGDEVFNFGKYKGQKVADVFSKEPSYLDWILKNDFPRHTKMKAQEIYNREKLRKFKN